MLSLDDPFVVAYKKELVRWNRQISLVSRKATGRVLDNLLYQSSAGFEALWGYVDNFVGNSLDNIDENLVDNPVGNSIDSILYFDLGSGGGLPGVIWSQLLSRQEIPVKSFLVEPRVKRSWFLERVCREGFPFSQESSSSCRVISDRWGGAVSCDFDSMERPLVLISLKALHLNDEAVIRGLRDALVHLPSPGRLVIARFYPGEQMFDQSLKDSLCFLTGGLALPDFPTFEYRDASILSIPAGGFSSASLVVSHYKF